MNTTRHGLEDFNVSGGAGSVVAIIAVFGETWHDLLDVEGKDLVVHVDKRLGME